MPVAVVAPDEIGRPQSIRSEAAATVRTVRAPETVLTSPTSPAAVSRWIICGRCVQIVAVVACGALHVVLGGGSPEAAFRSDVAALCFAGACLLLTTLALFIPVRRTDAGGDVKAENSAAQAPSPLQRSSVGRAHVLAQRFWRMVDVSTLGLSALLLLGHATPVLFELLAALSSALWTVFCCSVFASLCSLGGAASAAAAPAKHAPMYKALLALGKFKLLVAWAFCASSMYALLHFRPVADLRVPANIGRVEYFLLTALGGLLVSSVACSLVLAVTCRLIVEKRRLLRLGSEDDHVFLTRVTSVELFVRASVFSMFAHLLAVFALALLVYGFVGVMVLALARLSLWAARARELDRERDLERERKRNESKALAAGGAAGSAELNEDPDTVRPPLDLASTSPIVSPRSSKCSRRGRRADGRFSAALRKAATACFVFGFGGAKFLVLLAVFMFNVVFVQKFFGKVETRSFILAREGAFCGAAETLPDATSAYECARIAGATSHAFSFSARGPRQGRCLRHILPGNYSAAEYENAKRDPESWLCFGSDSDAFTWDRDVDFFLIAPKRSCSTIDLMLDGKVEVDFPLRQLSANEHAASETHLVGDTFYEYHTAFELPRASSEAVGALFGGAAFADGPARMTEWIVGAFTRNVRMVLSPPLRLPATVDSELQCTGVRRLAAACGLLGAVALAAAALMADVMSVFQTSEELSKLRAATANSFPAYLAVRGRARFLQGVALVVLQVAVSLGLALRVELEGTFLEGCGILSSPGTLAGSVCPVMWHSTVDFVANALLFLTSWLAALLPVLAVLGLPFGSRSLRVVAWLVRAAFQSDLRLTGWRRPAKKFSVTKTTASNASRPVPQWSRSGSSLRSEGSRGGAGCQGRLLTMVAAIPAAVGIWTPMATQHFQIDRFLEGYKPSDGNLADYVSRKGLCDASSSGLTLAFLFFPVFGGMIAKAMQYLNEHVVFAFGRVDASFAPASETKLSKNFSEGYPGYIQFLRWASCAAELVVLVLIQFDLLGTSPQSRLFGLSSCWLAVTAALCLRVILDMCCDLWTFHHAQRLLNLAIDLIERSVPEAIITEPSLSGHLCDSHQADMIKTCTNLQRLDWVRDARMPLNRRRVLVSSSVSLNYRTDELKRMLKSSERSDTGFHEVEAQNLVLLLLTDVSSTQILSCRAREAALLETRRRALQNAECEASKLQRQAERRAQRLAVEEAHKRIKHIADLKELAAARERRGVTTPWAKDLNSESSTWIRMSVRASTVCTVGALASSLEGGRLCDRQETSVVAIATGEVDISWRSGSSPQEVGIRDVRIRPSKHRLKLRRLNSDETDDEELEDVAEASFLMRTPHSPKGWFGKCRFCAMEETCRKRTASPWHSALEDDVRAAWKLTSWRTTWTAEAGIGDVDGAVAWSSTASPMRVDIDPAEELSLERAMQALEESLRNNVFTPQTLSLASVFLGALAARANSKKAAEASKKAAEAGKRARLLGVAGKMLRSVRKIEKPRGDKPKETRYLSKMSSVSIVSMPEVSHVEALRAAMQRVPCDIDALSLAIDSARNANVDPMLLSQADETYKRLLNKQQKALALEHAIESRNASRLRATINNAESAGIEATEFPDGDGNGILSKARRMLTDEEDNALASLRDAVVRGCVLSLQRSLAHVKEVGICDGDLVSRAEAMLKQEEEKKRRMALLKNAMASKNAALLRSAIDECEASGIADDILVLRKARKTLKTLERANDSSDSDEVKITSRPLVRGVAFDPSSVEASQALGGQVTPVRSNLSSKSSPLQSSPEAAATLSKEERASRDRFADELTPPRYFRRGVNFDPFGTAVSPIKSAPPRAPGKVKSPKAPDQQAPSMHEPQIKQSSQRTPARGVNFDPFSAEVSPARLLGRGANFDPCSQPQVPAADMPFLLSQPPAPQRRKRLPPALESAFVDSEMHSPGSSSDSPKTSSGPRLLRAQTTVSPKGKKASSTRGANSGSGSVGKRNAQEAMKQLRATAALKAVINQELPEAEMLRVALQQASAAGLVASTCPEIGRAEDLLAKEELKDAAIDQLRRSAAAHDVTLLEAALIRCRESHLEAKRLLATLLQLMEDRAREPNGLEDSAVREVGEILERERLVAHNAIQEALGNLRVLCRVRPPLRFEVTEEDGDAASVRRVDRYSISVQNELFKFGSVFGVDSSQAEIFSDLKGLVRSAVDGYNVLVMAFGPSLTGKTTTLCGGRAADARGVLPRAAEELFDIKAQDDWHVHVDIDVQMVEVYGRHQVEDLIGGLGRGSAAARSGRVRPGDNLGPSARHGSPKALSSRAIVRFVPAAQNDDASEERFVTVVEGAVTRRVNSRTEFWALVEDGYHRRHDLDAPRHVLVLAHLKRTKRSTGAVTSSKLVFADLAGCGQDAPPQIGESYDALETVLRAAGDGDRRAPFRDHALTQILQDCIGGSSKAALILSLAPGADTAGDCLYAARLASSVSCSSAREGASFAASGSSSPKARNRSGFSPGTGSSPSKRFESELSPLRVLSSPSGGENDDFVKSASDGATLTSSTLQPREVPENSALARSRKGAARPRRREGASASPSATVPSRLRDSSAVVSMSSMPARLHDHSGSMSPKAGLDIPAPSALLSTRLRDPLAVSSGSSLRAREGAAFFASPSTSLRRDGAGLTDVPKRRGRSSGDSASPGSQSPRVLR